MIVLCVSSGLIAMILSSDTYHVDIPRSAAASKRFCFRLSTDNTPQWTCIMHVLMLMTVAAQVLVARRFDARYY